MAPIVQIGAIAGLLTSILGDLSKENSVLLKHIPADKVGEVETGLKAAFEELNSNGNILQTLQETIGDDTFWSELLSTKQGGEDIYALFEIIRSLAAEYKSSPGEFKEKLIAKIQNFEEEKKNIILDEEANKEKKTNLRKRFSHYNPALVEFLLEKFATTDF